MIHHLAITRATDPCARGVALAIAATANRHVEQPCLNAAEHLPAGQTQ